PTATERPATERPAAAPAPAAASADSGAPSAPARGANADANGEQPGRPGRKNARGRRSSVPSWDEIMLGSPASGTSHAQVALYVRLVRSSSMLEKGAAVGVPNHLRFRRAGVGCRAGCLNAP